MGDEGLETEAIALLKSGRTPAEVYALAVGRGVDPAAAQALVERLLALKRQADARDPQRMREEAKWMYVNGATVPDVVAYFTSLDVPEAYAGPEAERIAGVARSMRPCQSCGAPSEPAELVMDLNARSICRGCNARGQIQRADNRAAIALVNSSPLAGDLLESMTSNVYAARPGCPACRALSALHVSQLRPDARVSYPITTRWVCGRCWRALG